MKDRIQVLIVDDHPMFREGVVRTLSSELDFEVVGQAVDALGAVNSAVDLVPDIVLLDITIPGNGLQAARAIAAASPVSKLVMLTASEAEEDVLGALKAGAKGYILKGVAGPDLVRILRSVHAGEAYVTPSLAASLLSDPRPDPSHGPFDDLSDRERQVLEKVASGFSNKEIASDLTLSEKTVKHYMTNILQKLQVRNRVEAALLAQRSTGKKT